MPARDEEESLRETLRDLYRTFKAVEIPHEIVVVDDGSKDGTWAVLEGLKAEIPTLAPVRNSGPHGFGRAIIYGLNNSKGDAVVIMMADASDAPSDAVKYWRLLNDQGYECAFGSRFIKGGQGRGLPAGEIAREPGRQLSGPGPVRPRAERHHQCLQGLPPDGDRWVPSADGPAP
jgi:glycosyltransferase involved in cell wall biosynthesis